MTSKQYSFRYAASNAIYKSERRSGKGVVKAGQGFTLFISNEDRADIIKIVQLLENSVVVIDGVTEAVKHEIKKTRTWISWCLVSSFGCFSGTSCDFFMGKEPCEQEEDVIITWINIFSAAPFFMQYRDY